MNVDAPVRWSLDDLMPPPVDQALDSAFSELDQTVARFEAMRALLSEDMSTEAFNNLLDQIEHINLLMSRLEEAYTDLWLTEDTQNPDALTLRDKVDESLTECSNRMLFFDMWFKALPAFQAWPICQLKRLLGLPPELFKAGCKALRTSTGAPDNPEISGLILCSAWPASTWITS